MNGAQLDYGEDPVDDESDDEPLPAPPPPPPAATPGDYGTFHVSAPSSRGEVHFIFRCPGCKRPHAVAIEGGEEPRRWTFDGNYQAPTLSPSLLVHQYGIYQPQCHSFVRGGRIEFLADCAHALAGQTVPLPPFSWEIEDPANR